MVLLTSSAISAAISGGVVCLFTFLLFLSGYALQQQSVRSLQAALQEPVEVRIRVQPTLPPQFQNVDEEGDDDNDTSSTNIEIIPPQETAQIAMGVDDQEGAGSLSDVIREPTPQQLWHAHVDGSPFSPTSSQQDTIPTIPQAHSDLSNAHFAYVLSLPSPTDLCSALLFTKSHRQNSQLNPQIDILYLYPSDWETSSHPTHRSALRLLLESEHKHSAILHPVPISKVWAGIDVESQLLSELARNPWPYDRVMYLRTPGMVVDTMRLDGTMTATYVERGLMKTEWTKLRAPVRRGAGGVATLHPDVLLFAQGRGLMEPVGELKGTLTARASTSRGVDNGDGVNDDFLAREAAYVLFDEKELRNRRKEKLDHNDIFERFERERELACEGTDLLV
ncbi:hypothetical protein PMZ80_009416 [Knufia obscura]|uniref:Uncharacterized protein n=1 Tax=Knufia obscura TaxID=1635080 RepID=A0ABR0RCT3_9EURO|nr:hypothetical protein PMZ80_009416 [Knufia obscura]